MGEQQRYDWIALHMLSDAFAIPYNLLTNSRPVYGGCNYDDEAWCHPAVDRAFERELSKV